jgi:hypothetical protein
MANVNGGLKQATFVFVHNAKLDRTTNTITVAHRNVTTTKTFKSSSANEESTTKALEEFIRTECGVYAQDVNFLLTPAMKLWRELPQAPPQ